MIDYVMGILLWNLKNIIGIIHICVGYDRRTYITYSTVHSCPIKQNSDEAMVC